PNPKNSITELGIAYFEASTGRTWVYAYNGQNNYASYLSMDFLGYFENSYTTNGSVATLTLDNSEFEGALETGFSFGERIGIWFHPSADLNVTGDSMGLSNFHARMNGWLDTNFDGNCNNPNNGCITAVPEPATLALVAMGFGLIGFSRRRQALAVR
ncbi:MAG: PEP-CTERM sorting domain-containing protein, partial [Pseudomonadota bacterium]